MKPKSKQAGPSMVVTLKPEAWLDPSKPDTAEDVMKDLLKRVTDKSNSKPARVQYFPNIGALSISASADFIEMLRNEPEVLRADVNEQQQSMKIEPIRKRPVAFGSRSKKK
jgi:hypothetical protein